jgi:hypothetical protein
MSMINLIVSATLIDLISSPVCLAAEVIEITPFPNGNFVIKIRARLKKECNLQIRLYFNDGHYDYSYQLYTHGKMQDGITKKIFLIYLLFPTIIIPKLALC